MIYTAKYILTAIAFLDICHFGMPQTNLYDVCESQAASLPICSNCLQSAFCGDLPVPSGPECPRHQVCSMISGEGPDFCTDIIDVTNSNATVDHVCSCKERGCFLDPYNPDYHINCEIKGTPILIPPCEVGLLNTSTCICDANIECPPCGAISTQSGFCQKEYTDCSGSVPVLLECAGEEECFYPPDCQCRTIEEVCPECGYVLDQNDPSSYIYCKYGEVILLECPANYIYDTSSCTCKIETTLAPDSTTATIPTDASCLPCGLIKGGPICSEFFSCSLITGEIVDGPFYCPVNSCFDENTCGCIMN